MGQTVQIMLPHAVDSRENRKKADADYVLVACETGLLGGATTFELGVCPSARDEMASFPNFWASISGGEHFFWCCCWC
jgi:hypothetical protein